MERDSIYVRNIGLIKVRVNHEVGVAKDETTNKFYIRNESHIPGSTHWTPEEHFWLKYKNPEKGGISVYYGVKLDDPNRELIHKLYPKEDGMYQYQIDRESGYVQLVKVAQKKKFEPFAPEGMRNRRGSIRIRRFK